MNRCSQEIHLLILRIFAAIIPQLKQWVFSPQEIIITSSVNDVKYINRIGGFVSAVNHNLTLHTTKVVGFLLQ